MWVDDNDDGGGYDVITVLLCMFCAVVVVALPWSEIGKHFINPEAI